MVLASTFAVSHNVEETKPLAAGNRATTNLQQDFSTRDWGVQQVRPLFFRSTQAWLLEAPRATPVRLGICACWRRAQGCAREVLELLDGVRCTIFLFR